MNCFHFAISTALLLTVSGLAEAAVVTETMTGVIAGQSTIDTAGDFGPAGADLNGKPVVVHIQYAPVAFNSNTPCAHSFPCTVYASQGVPAVSQSVLVTIKLNGKTLAFQPSYRGQLTLFTDASDNLQLVSDAGSATTNSGVAVFLTLKSRPVFGAPLSPSNPPRLHKTTDLFEIFPPQSQTANEVLNFSIQSETK